MLEISVGWDSGLRNFKIWKKQYHAARIHFICETCSKENKVEKLYENQKLENSYRTWNLEWIFYDDDGIHGFFETWGECDDDLSDT